MLTIFTIPKAFTGQTAILQRNAIRSWTRLRPSCEILLCGDDPGVAEAAAELGVAHVGGIETNEHGTPLLSAVFSHAQANGRHDLLMYVNADIIFFQGLIDAVSTIHLPRFLLCGRRYDLDVEEELAFEDPSWPHALRARVDGEGVLHGLSGLDYFIFRRGTVEMRRFAVGRPCWDNWLIFDTRRRGIPVVDATGSILAVHQNHDFSHSKFATKNQVRGPELQANLAIAGGRHQLLNLRAADWRLTAAGPVHVPFPDSLWPALSMWYPWRVLLAALRTVRS